MWLINELYFQIIIIDKDVRFVSDIVNFWRHDFFWSTNTDIVPIAVSGPQQEKKEQSELITGQYYLPNNQHWWPITWLNLKQLRNIYDQEGIPISHLLADKVAYLGESWAHSVQVGQKEEIYPLVSPKAIVLPKNFDQESYRLEK